MSADTTSSETSTGDPGSPQATPYRSVWGMALFILGLHLVGWGALVGLIAPEQYEIGQSQIFGIGLGVTAYTLGMRHAFDADHIAAIDNTTRKLLADGQPTAVGRLLVLPRPLHASSSCLCPAARSRRPGAGRPGRGRLLGAPAAHRRRSAPPSPASSSVLIGIINLVVLVGILRVFRGMRQGHYDEADAGRPARTTAAS